MTAIAAGDPILAAKSDGTVWAWGLNQYGQLGNSTNNGGLAANPVPAQIAGLSGVSAVAAGFAHSLALKSDGSVWAWGLNQYGQLGNSANSGSSNANSTPAQVSGLSAVLALAAGYYHTPLWAATAPCGPGVRTAMVSLAIAPTSATTTPTLSRRRSADWAASAGNRGGRRQRAQPGAQERRHRLCLGPQ